MSPIARGVFFLLTVACLFVGPARGQSVDLPPQQKVMARRAAEADAYRKMAERVLGLTVQSETRVRDFVTESDEIALALDRFIKGIRLSEPRHYDDGSCEVDAEVTIQQVVSTLKTIRDEVYEGGKWRNEDFEEITRRTETRVLRETGAGAARAESSIPDAKDQPIVAPIVRQRPVQLDLPEIYSQYSPAARLNAKRVAEADAYRKLVERIRGLQIDSQTRVRDFITESDRIRLAAEGELRGVRTVGVRYAADGVVEVEMAVTIEQVVTTIKRVHDEVYEGGRWTKDHFDQIHKHTTRKVITVLGNGPLHSRSEGRSTEAHEPTITLGDEVIVIE